MSIKVTWYNEEKTVICYHYEDPWTWQDYYAAREDAKALLSSVPYRVNVIVDMRNSSLLPSGVLFEARRFSDNAGKTSLKVNDNEGLAVIVGAGGFVRSIYAALQKVNPKMTGKLEMTFARSIEEAYALFGDEATLQQ